MLERLEIRQLALIESLDLDFAPGLNLLTGETGSGKTIVLDALGLALGQRASTDLIRAGAEACRVCAVFTVTDAWRRQWAPWFEAKGLALAGGELRLKRELSHGGRSRAWIDDEGVATNTLAELSESLVDVHGQHEHQSLLKPSQHLAILDRFGGHDAQLDAVAEAFADWTRRRRALEGPGLSPQERRQREEFLAFQVGELEQARLRPGEWEALKEQARLGASVGKRVDLLAKISGALLEGDATATAQGQAALADLRRLAALDNALAPLALQVERGLAELEDASSALRAYRDGVDSDPAALERVQARLHELERLSRKYGADEAGMLEALCAARAELESLRLQETDLEGLRSSLAASALAYAGAASALRRAREKAALAVAKAAARELKALLGEKAQFQVSLKRCADPAGPFDVGGEPCRGSALGVDEAEFLFAPNPGEGLKPLAKIASGGELSRLALALKTVFAKAGGPPSLVFDEVDAGISGRAAETVGERLAALARERQVLVVTHLPQIASQSARHWRVSKRVDKGHSFTEAVPLDQAGREQEVAQLIAGAAATDSALAHARELLKR